LCPTGWNSIINNGYRGAICSQVLAKWTTLSTLFVTADLTNQTFNVTIANASIANLSIPALDPRTSKDCLLLDGFVPQRIFELSKGSRDSDRGAPVSVWAS
jgi:hypothetical protein